MYNELRIIITIIFIIIIVPLALILYKIVQYVNHYCILNEGLADVSVPIYIVSFLCTINMLAVSPSISLSMFSNYNIF